ncbi:MAG: hypothetical protein QG662_920 [Pseudomonadota bacterium]|nr:hypothetical protein [Pseudomonadota bacterium]
MRASSWEGLNNGPARIMCHDLQMQRMRKLRFR